MTKTHYSIREPSIQATAWQNSRTETIPIWVCRTFHDIDMSGRRHSLTHPTAELDDWIVAIECPGGYNISVIRPELFEANWAPLETEKEAA